IATVESGLVGEVVVHARHRGVGVLRRSGARVRRNRIGYGFSEGIRTSRYPAYAAGYTFCLCIVRFAQNLQAGPQMAAVRREEILGVSGNIRQRQERWIKDALGLGAIAAYSGPFGAAEEEQLVLHDRSADRITELVAGETR